MVDTSETPLPPANRAPVQVEVPDWFDLASNSTTTQLNRRQFGGQAIEVQHVGARPEDDDEGGTSTTSSDDEDEE